MLGSPGGGIGGALAGSKGSYSGLGAMAGGEIGGISAGLVNALLRKNPSGMSRLLAHLIGTVPGAAVGAYYGEGLK
jgi:hypothetical protein